MVQITRVAVSTNQEENRNPSWLGHSRFRAPQIIRLFSFEFSKAPPSSFLPADWPRWFLLTQSKSTLNINTRQKDLRKTTHQYHELPQEQCNLVYHRMFLSSFLQSYFLCTYQNRQFWCDHRYPAWHCLTLNLCMYMDKKYNNVNSDSQAYTFLSKLP